MTTIHLSPSQFSAQESLLVEFGPLRASTFTFPSGVLAVRLQNERGELVMLPFQGQQIWDAHFDGRRWTMQSMFDQPYPTTEFLATFGGFMQHCGALAMGSPGPHDNHPLHGELPNAAYQKAWLEVGHDPRGITSPWEDSTATRALSVPTTRPSRRSSCMPGPPIWT